MKRFSRRPWGWFWVLLDRPHFKVKLLRFKAGEECSTQYHEFRSELWLFLRGSGLLKTRMIGADVEELKVAGDYASIQPLMQHHYVADTSTCILEIQYGRACEEADEIMIHDKYGRHLQ